MRTALLAFFLAVALGFDREQIDPNPPVPKPDHGCFVVVTSQGSIVVCH